MSSCVVCPICCEIYKNSDEVYSTSCGHVYHYGCMQHWKSRSTSCPQCRTHDPSTYKLYLSFESEAEVTRKTEVLESNLKLAEKSVSEVQLLLDAKESNINALHLELENQITSSSLLQTKLEEAEEKLIKINSQLDESIFSRSRIEEELDIIKKYWQQFNQEKNNTSNSEQMQLQINYLEKQLERKDKYIEDILIQKGMLEQKLQQSAIEMGSKAKAETPDLTKCLQNPRSNVNPQTKSKQKCKKNADSTAFLLNISRPNLSLSDLNDAGSNSCTEDKSVDIPKSIVIKKVPINIKESDYKTLIIKLGQLMGLSIGESDVSSVTLMEKKNMKKTGTHLSLCVQFKTVQNKIDFLTNKRKLREHPETSEFLLYEYNSDKTVAMYNYATVLRNFGYKVYCRQDEVYVSKNNMLHPLKIYATQQIHALLKQENSSMNAVGSISSSLSSLLM